MLSDLQSWTIVGLASLGWLALSAVGFVSGGPANVLVISDIVPLLLIGASAFERRGWRWGRLHPHVVGTPVIRGTWKGTLTSMWIDPATGGSPAPKSVYLAVEQTLTTVGVWLFTDESTSRSIAGTITNVPTRGWVVSYTYLNTPGIERRSTSPVHYGGTLLNVIESGDASLDGEYWTDRASKGRLVFRSHRTEIARSFEQAEDLFPRSVD